jgi:hypothetical protein
VLSHAGAWDGSLSTGAASDKDGGRHKEVSTANDPSTPPDNLA